MSNNNGNSTISGFPGNLNPDLTPNEERILLCFEFLGTRMRDHISKSRWDEARDQLDLAWALLEKPGTYLRREIHKYLYKRWCNLVTDFVLSRANEFCV